MTAREHAYYEIALTGTQVVIALLAIVALVFVAFFAGLQIGSEGAQAGATVAEASPDQSGAAAEEGEESDEFDFFADEEAETSPPSLAELAEEPSPGTTLAEDVSGEAGAPPAEEATEEAGSAEQTPPVLAEATEGTPSPAAGEYVIQVFSSDDQTQAREVVRRLEGAGLPVFVASSSVEGRTMHRVRVGPYEDESEAERVATRVRRDFRLDTWVTSGG